MKNNAAYAILEFWFSERITPLHFVKNSRFDKEVSDTFADIYINACAGKYNEWSNTAEGALALVILYDQFPRNMFRDTARSFESDSVALITARTALENKAHHQLTPAQCIFLYMPFMHSENLEDQELSVKLYRQLGEENSLNFAIAHRDIIVRFSRFPHRNLILNRSSSPEETSFLKQPGSAF